MVGYKCAGPLKILGTQIISYHWEHTRVGKTRAPDINQRKSIGAERKTKRMYTYCAYTICVPLRYVLRRVVSIEYDSRHVTTALSLSL
jgi:hypothetical protein